MESREAVVIWDYNHPCIAWGTEEGKHNNFFNVPYHIHQEAVMNEEATLEYCHTNEIYLLQFYRGLGKAEFLAYTKTFFK